jgi:hypothetical protein
VSDDLAASYVRYELSFALMWGTFWLICALMCIALAVIVKRKTFTHPGDEPFFVFPLFAAAVCVMCVMWNANTLLKCVVVPQDVVRYYEWRNNR